MMESDEQVVRTLTRQRETEILDFVRSHNMRRAGTPGSHDSHGGLMRHVRRAGVGVFQNLALWIAPRRADVRHRHCL